MVDLALFNLAIDSEECRQGNAEPAVPPARIYNPFATQGAGKRTEPGSTLIFERSVTRASGTAEVRYGIAREILPLESLTEMNEAINT